MSLDVIRRHRDDNDDEGHDMSTEHDFRTCDRCGKNVVELYHDDATGEAICPRCASGAKPTISHKDHKHAATPKDRALCRAHIAEHGKPYVTPRTTSTKAAK